MENNPSQSSGQAGKFFNGFLLGLIVGAAIVFLLGTKKGKKLLKALSEEKLDNIANLLESASDEEKLKEVIEKKEAPVRGFAIKQEHIYEKPKARRFFRGISRRVN